MEFTAATETLLDGLPSEFFLSDLQKLQQQAKKLIELRGKYSDTLANEDNSFWNHIR